MAYFKRCLVIITFLLAVSALVSAQNVTSPIQVDTSPIAIPSSVAAPTTQRTTAITEPKEPATPRPATTQNVPSPSKNPDPTPSPSSEKETTRDDSSSAAPSTSKTKSATRSTLKDVTIHTSVAVTSTIESAGQLVVITTFIPTAYVSPSLVGVEDPMASGPPPAVIGGAIGGAVLVAAVITVFTIVKVRKPKDRNLEPDWETPPEDGEPAMRNSIPNWDPRMTGSWGGGNQDPYGGRTVFVRE